MKRVTIYFVDDQKHGSITHLCYEIGIASGAVLELHPFDPKSAIINFPLVNVLRYDIIKE